MKRLLTLFLLFFAVYRISYAQVTTSSVTGTVTQSTGETRSGATIRAVHSPSGTAYSAASNAAGRFNLANMRVGGPYRIEVTYVGQDPIVYEDIYLQLGQPYVLNAVFGDGLKELDEIVIETGGRVNTMRTGASTNVGLKKLNELPQINRSITDFTRLTPQASGNSFAGRDARYNNLQIDGANFNNGFGLSGNPLPGGNSQPISLDAIQEITVNIAPVDILQSGFTGAGINAVTRSGTNRMEGSAYYFFQNQNLQGRRIGSVSVERLDALKRNYGVRVGGPIVKDKLFLFFNAEREEATGDNASGSNRWRPSEDGVAIPDINVARTSRSDLELVRNHLVNQWGWDPGRYEGYAEEARESSTKFLARLDWNISEKHKMALRYNQVVGNSMQTANASSGPNPRSQTSRIGENSITFENGNYGFQNIVRSLTAELNSNLNSRLNNQFLATYTRIQDTRTTPSNQLFPFVDIGDGTHSNNSSPHVNYMSFGTELFSYNNDVYNNNYSIVNNVMLSANRHNFTFGGAFEIQNFGNSYTRMGTSYYRYASVGDFLTTGGPNEVAPIMFGLTYPYLGQDTYARVNFGMASIYAQDRWTVNDKLTFMFGLRAELPLYMNKLTPNPSIDALRLLDVHGMPTNYHSGLWPKSRLMVSPRVGANFDVLGDRSLVLRGSTGFFTGQVPFVWLSNMPTNSGVLQNTIEPGSYGDVSGWIGNVRFNPDPYYHLNNVPEGAESVFIATPNEGAPSSFALVDRNFRMPMVWRTSLGGDYRIPGTPVVFTTDLLYTRDINAAFQFGANRKQTNTFLNYGASEQDGDYGDNRSFYPIGIQRFNPQIGANNATVLTNTSVKGYALSATFGLSVPNYRGFSAGLYYTYSDAMEVSGNPGSNASSAWVGSPSINGPNDQILHPSSFAMPHRIIGDISYRFEYENSLATTVGLVYVGVHQGRFSYTYTSDINRDGINSSLIYLPRDLSTLTFINRYNAAGELLFTPEQQLEALTQFVANNGLEKYRGSYLPRNGFLLPWLNRFDLRFLQDLYTTIGQRRHTLQLSFDFINFGNFINSRRGIRSRLNNARLLYGNHLVPGENRQGEQVLNTVPTPNTGIPTFNMNLVDGELPTTPFQPYSTTATTWQMMVGFRYIF